MVAVVGRLLSPSFAFFATFVVVMMTVNLLCSCLAMVAVASSRLVVVVVCAPLSLMEVEMACLPSLSFTSLATLVVAVVVSLPPSPC